MNTYEYIQICTYIHYRILYEYKYEFTNIIYELMLPLMLTYTLKSGTNTLRLKNTTNIGTNIICLYTLGDYSGLYVHICIHIHIRILNNYSFYDYSYYEYHFQYSYEYAIRSS